MAGVLAIIVIVAFILGSESTNKRQVGAVPVEQHQVADTATPDAPVVTASTDPR
jgi:hypothetical protein